MSETRRLEEARSGQVAWKAWGPYLSERQWGTVREDYGTDGNSWDHFTHDQARSRAYRWGEDGLGGLCDDRQRLCFALALWNHQDPFLKERLFGLTNSEGNHGEDVKEYYYYLDSTPTHSYMRFLYKYPQRAFPYADLVETNRRRSRHEPEYELIDTAIFDEDRYFDVVVEYAKVAPEDIVVRITAHNRGPEAAPLLVLPTLWFRNTWSWGDGAPRPSLRRLDREAIEATHPELGFWVLRCEGAQDLLFTENETNAERLWGQPNPTPYVKDAFHALIVEGRRDAVNPAATGTKAAAVHELHVPAGESRTVRLRLRAGAELPAFDDFDEVFAQRLAEADEFYAGLTPESLDEDARRVYRQALAGMLWTKQFYHYDLDRWLKEHESHPLLHDEPRVTRNREWFHMVNADIISMPDKWEYPWYAAWDLAFHAIALAIVDIDFAKQQLELMLDAAYQHPNGQIPAYEWNFSDVNPPVHAWATLYVFSLERAQGRTDVGFLERSFLALLQNFNWWVNRKDIDGRNVFAGGFLGLDNIGVFDRSGELPTGGHLEQADGTAWMAFYCQCMLEMALILAEHDRKYEETAFRFVQHSLWISYAMDRIGRHHDELWDEEDGFFYDLLRLPDGQAVRLRVRSLVGLLPLCASTVFEGDSGTRFPTLARRLAEFRDRHPEVVAHVAPLDGSFVGHRDRRLLSPVNRAKLERLLGYMLDEGEFLSPYGIRSLSRHHLEHPFRFRVGDGEHVVQYLPAESDSGMFGGNSNWRGPIWLPMNALIIRALLNLYAFYGDDFRVACPTGSGRLMTLFEVAEEIARRVTRIFLRDEQGRRPVFGGARKFQEDPHWRDHLLFYEYFHGENGAGLGASHQTGWSGLVAPMLQFFARVNARDLLEAARGPLQTVLRQATA